ncbi:MAG: putative glucose-6-phosphate 1-epimerase [Chloroflexi bacterium ADurb.Bin325]|nr:MAG: putative glucose-6-phosphate 1-epimerase [Chloroflexi bacterium ADurb.Bin325]
MQGSAEIVAGAAGLPKVVISAADGARAEAYLYGAHVTSWVPAGGEERLYLSPQADYRPGAAIRGGAPVVFPQFSGMGPLPKHGFLRNLPWEYLGAHEEADRITAEFAIVENEQTLALWPHRFRGRLAVTADKVQEDAALRFVGEVDRIYFAAPRQVTLAEPGRRLTVAAERFPDVVVWNPGPALAATLADLPPGGYGQFVCIEAAIVGRPIELLPGQTWQGSQTLTA